MSPQKEKYLSEKTGSPHPSRAQRGVSDGGACFVTDGAQVVYPTNQEIQRDWNPCLFTSHIEGM